MAAVKGKVALVTAASQGIGLAVAHELVRCGARTGICGRDEAKVAAAAATLSECGGEALGVQADLAEPADVERLIAAVNAQLGPIDILVCNTGGPPLARVVDLAPEDWDRWMRAMFYPAVTLVRAAVEQMEAGGGGGAIVFLTTVSVKQPRQGAVLSTAIRGAIAGMSKQLANELGPDGIRVNHVMPGPIATDRLMSLVEAKARAASQSVQERLALLHQEVPLGRLGQPEEIARVVRFLCSDEASFVTGVTLQVDGGQTKALL